MAQGAKWRFFPDYLFVMQGQKQRKVLIYPEKTLYPWATVEDYVVVKDAKQITTIFRDNARKRVMLFQERFLPFIETGSGRIDPLVFTYPLTALKNINELESRKLDEGKIRLKMKLTYKRINIQEDISVESIVSWDKNGVAEKTLSISSTGQGIDSISYAEMESFEEMNGVHFPKIIKVTQWWQVSGGSIRLPEGVVRNQSILPYNTITDIASIENNPDLPTASAEYTCTVKDISINQPIKEEYFWMDVPDGFAYQDNRFMNIYRQNPGVMRDNRNRLAGKGPAEFLQDISEYLNNSQQ